MTKPEFAAALAAEVDMTKKLAVQVVDALFSTDTGVIAKALKAGEKITLPGFGSFEAKTRAARQGINPATGKKIAIAAKTVPAFKAGKGLKDALA